MAIDETTRKRWEKEDKMKESRTFDLSIRLPMDKKYMKQELVKIAKKNHLTLNQLVTYIIGWYLDGIKKNKRFFVQIK